MIRKLRIGRSGSWQSGIRKSIPVFAAIALVAMVSMDVQAQYTSTHHVREVVGSGRRSCRQLPKSQMMTLDIVLQLRDEAGLKSFLEELYDPNSGSYHQFLTPAQFTERFGPSGEQEYDAVVGFAKANGLAVIGGSRDGMEVQVKGRCRRWRRLST